MLKKANIGYETITESTDGYELNGKIDARFYNLSTKAVQIGIDSIPPKQSFSAGVTDHEVYGRVPVQFADDETAPRITLTFGTTLTDKNC
jgi:hypothetical protein